MGMGAAQAHVEALLEFDVRILRARRSGAADNGAMLTDPIRCYQALLSRDSRFDGRMFVGVTSTGIYCRPVCRVRTPRLENCRFFQSAAAAEEAGFRPCLKCLPELAPGHASIDAGSRLAHAAATALEAGEGSETVNALAKRLGVSARHLRRVFSAEFGVTPAAFVRTSRLLHAKRLLAQTSLPVTDIAFHAGFASLRTFNTAFRDRYRLSPSSLRREPRATAADQGEAGIELDLAFRPPFDWERMLRFFARRCVDGVESVDIVGGMHRRVVSIESRGQMHAGWVEVKRGTVSDRLRLRVSPLLIVALPGLISRMRRQFDLDCVPSDVDAALGELALAHPGLRLPGCCDGFEMAVRAILGQQITVAAATTLARRFASRFGEALETPWPDLVRIFPQASVIASASVDDIASLGVIGKRAASIICLARAVANGEIVLAPHADVGLMMERLQGLPGIGSWTAEYIAMRALAWPDAFPSGDLGVRSALGGVTAAQAAKRAEVWRPWRAYAVVHLWAQLEKPE